MKDNLLEMLMYFLENNLLHSQKKNGNTTKSEDSLESESTHSHDELNFESETLVIKSPRLNSIRIFTKEEKQRLTKASYQFLMRLIQLDVIAQETLELIINQLIFSESRFVTLYETKYTIRNALAEHIDRKQLALLDLILYHKEDRLPLH